ncbi:Solute carrier family 2, facilitated glucose transporter member 1 [Nosema granulosis]|uniref:Solute carrier family 2, facilitated glucose transporter member 1 n=1 Tax=Nosema granulosis TaxID=83296 RepID=A0A9P6GZE4_9MICR|nr:Solute carrier family 2, facilitated glucose transporter member 1 [Nosema granulosis]
MNSTTVIKNKTTNEFETAPDHTKNYTAIPLNDDPLDFIIEEKNNRTPKPTSNISIGKRLFCIIVIGLSSATFGYGLTSTDLYTNTDFEQAQKLKYENLDYAIWKGLAQNCIFLGGFFATLALYFIPTTSCKNLLIIASFINIGAYALITFFPDIIALVISKIFIGIAAGIVCTVVPNFLSNYSIKSYEDLIAGVHSIGICVGLVLGHGMGGLMKYLSINSIAIGVLIGFILNTISLFFLKDISSGVPNEREIGIIALLKNKACRMPVLTAILYHMGQHFSGVDFLVMSTSSFFVDKSNYYLIVLTSMLCAIPFSFLGGFLINKVGKKPMMMISCFLLAFTTLLFGLGIPSTQSYLIYCFVFSYNIGVATVPWIIPTELFPSEYFKAGNVLGVLANWLSGFVFNYTLSFLYAGIGNNVWFIFTVLTVGIMLFAGFFTTEGEKIKDMPLELK